MTKFIELWYLQLLHPLRLRIHPIFSIIVAAAIAFHCGTELMWNWAYAFPWHIDNWWRSVKSFLICLNKYLLSLVIRGMIWPVFCIGFLIRKKKIKNKKTCEVIDGYWLVRIVGLTSCIYCFSILVENYELKKCSMVCN